MHEIDSYFASYVDTNLVDYVPPLSFIVLLNLFKCDHIYLFVSGAVLIFLPGYDDIVSLRDRILYNDTRFSTISKR